jgi:hypothetical protein
LEELLFTVTDVIATKDTSELEPVSGFFFGSTEVDKWYWEDLKRTKKELKTLLDKTITSDISFIYQASW